MADTASRDPGSDRVPSARLAESSGTAATTATATATATAAVPPPAVHTVSPSAGSEAASLGINQATVITVKRGVNELIPVSLGFVNRIVTPFARPEVVSSSLTGSAESCEEFCIRGNVVYVSPRETLPLGMFITEKGRPERSLSLTLLPRRIPPREIFFRFPDGEDRSGLASAPEENRERRENAGDYVTEIKSLLTEAALNRIPQGYELRDTAADMRLPSCAQRGLTFSFTSPGQRLTGRRFALYIGVVRNTTRRDIEFDESSCSGNDVAAVAAWPEILLPPGGKSEIFVVRRLYPEGTGAGSFRPNLLREGRTLIRGGSDGQK